MHDRERLGFSLCLGLISRFLSLGVVWFWGLPPFLPFLPEMETFPRIFSPRALDPR